ncbi:CYFA0S14e01860g1_1 [Cyberlindnera fabianii]|uniref:Phospholipid scramblase n=1 Tax=Cyberlindnera fabianii TaxID=36022 RepID=A0A061B2Y4_CYBFA|nr:CYFA0S14e01860g1_1 [Cyberlindnera fabianii]
MLATALFSLAITSIESRHRLNTMLKTPLTHTIRSCLSSRLRSVQQRTTAISAVRFYSPLPRGSRSPANRTRIAYERGQYQHPEPESNYTYTYASTGAVPNPNGVITESDGIYRILSEPTLVIERQMEMMNVFLGFEQANQYVIMDALGNRLGFMMERDLGFVKMMMRQIYRLHRPFLVDVFDNAGEHLMTIRRPFSFINSHIKAILPRFQNEDDGVIGESVQSWHPWRRRYNLFKAEETDDFNQFGAIDAPFLSFDFPVRDENGIVIGSVDRNWVGLGREMFTDTGVYIIRMDPASFAGMQSYYPEVGGPLTLDQRAVLLANAVSVDFDYFSRHSNRGGLIDFGPE